MAQFDLSLLAGVVKSQKSKDNPHKISCAVINIRGSSFSCSRFPILGHPGLSYQSTTIAVLNELQTFLLLVPLPLSLLFGYQIGLLYLSWITFIWLLDIH
ncbi:hypothetical protein NIES2100_68330 [Calothrix sp. NIES-2100]|nr:hypothetical protein NIES2100_68330 [Calothrix sp. NIES-2100]